MNELKRDYKQSVTTGSLATATSLAGLEAIIKSPDIHNVEIKTPTETLTIFIKNCQKISDTEGQSTAIKYPYDDPDVTVNIEITSTVKLIDKTDLDSENVIIHGGKGVGIITKKGLQVPVNSPAINPIPQKMIKKNLEKLVPKGKVAHVTISIPKGEEIAHKTMNPRLGIVNGISILGTTGIARSMSSKAYKDSLLCQLDIAQGESFKDLVFVPGNIGEKIALNILDIEKDQIIQMTNFVGFMLNAAEERGIKEITLVGHIGKLVKVAGGIFNTKHSVADGRKEIFAAHSSLCGAEQSIIKEIFESKTTEEILTILKRVNLDKKVLNSIASGIKSQIYDRFQIKTNVILVDMESNILNSNYTIEHLKK